jgi:hypothetical protein
MQFLNVPVWNGRAFAVRDLFELKKGNRLARCALQTHPLGLELRLIAGSELLQSRLCRRQDDVLNTCERWKAPKQPEGRR